jgi:hypothetical protein
VKGLRVAEASTLEQANRYLEKEFLPWWNQHLVVIAASPTDAHRPLGQEHLLDASLSLVDTRQVANDYTIRFDRKIYQIAREHVKAGLRGANVRVEARLDGSIAVRFGNQYLGISVCQPQPKFAPPASHPARSKPGRPSEAWRRSQPELFQSKTVLWRAAKNDRTLTRQTIDEGSL